MNRSSGHGPCPRASNASLAAQWRARHDPTTLDQTTVRCGYIWAPPATGGRAGQSRVSASNQRSCVGHSDRH